MRKQWLAIGMLAGGGLWAADQKTAGVPADAVKVDEHSYRHTDKAGKVWIYRRTPFGMSKTGEEDLKKAAQQQAPKVETPVNVTDLGDSYFFERTSPWGTNRWTVKKTALNEEEKGFVAAWQERMTAERAKGSAAVGAKQ